MEPLKFEQQNTIYGADQPEYIPLPAFVDQTTKEVEATFCYNVSLKEAEEIMRTRQIWVTQLTFGNSFQPFRMGVDFPFGPNNPAISLDIDVFSAINRVDKEKHGELYAWLNMAVAVMKRIISNYPYGTPVSENINKELLIKPMQKFLMDTRGEFIPKLWCDFDFDNYVGIFKMQSIITVDDHSTNGKIIQL